MALIASSNTLHPPSWDETIVPALRKRTLYFTSILGNLLHIPKQVSKARVAHCLSVCQPFLHPLSRHPPLFTFLQPRTPPSENEPSVPPLPLTRQKEARSHAQVFREHQLIVAPISMVHHA